jgi:predicted component of viral defense system (DUF524 family)
MTTDSPPTSRFSFRDANGAHVPVPREWTPHLVELAIPPDDYTHARLLLQGELLPLFRQSLDDQERVLALWPRSGVGRYRLTLQFDTETVEELVCTVLPEKITEAAYEALIADLQGDRLPTSIAIGLERTGALSGVEFKSRDETTLQGELQRLHRAVAGSERRVGLAPILNALSRDPHRVLTKTERWVPAERVRRLEPVGLIQAVRTPQNLDRATRQPLRVPDVRVEHTVDVYENRLVKLYSEQVASRLRRLATAFELEGQLAGVAQVEELQRALRPARLEAAFLDEVSMPRALPTQLTMVLMRRPEYRAALEGYLEFHRETYVQLDAPALDAPLENLPELYELWGTLQVLDVLLQSAEELGYEARAQRLVGRIGRGVYIKVLPDGEKAIELAHPQRHTVVTLIPQRHFTKSGDPYHSISFTQIPDVVVCVDEPGQPPNLIIFDPKYKLRSESAVSSDGEDEEQDAGPQGRPKKLDIDRMHAYRDAIRDAAGSRVVSYVAIMYPGVGVLYGDHIEALSAIPSRPEVLRSRLQEVLREALVSQ